MLVTLSLLFIARAIKVVYALPASNIYTLEAGESSQASDREDYPSDDHDDFDLDHDFYQLSLEPKEASSSKESKYKAQITPAKYKQKQNASFLRHDMARMKKAERKHDLLVNHDFDGMRKLIQQYRNERRFLRIENDHHGYKCANVGSKAIDWEILAHALDQETQSPLSLPTLTRSEKRGLDEYEQVELQHEMLHRLAEQRVIKLIGRTPLSSGMFSVDRSETKLRRLQSTMRDIRGREVSQRRLQQAINKHDHRVNALIEGKAADASALAAIYYQDVDKHEKALRRKSVKEERVNTRRTAWESKIRELLMQAEQDVPHEV